MDEHHFIDRDTVVKGLRMAHDYKGAEFVSMFPASEVAEVIRCKDCKYFKQSETVKLDGAYVWNCTYHQGAAYRRLPDDYCSKAEFLTPAI